MKQKKIQSQALERLLRNADELGLNKAARIKLQWFLFYVTHNENVSLTCRHFGIARSTFNRWLNRFDARDERSLEEESRRPLNVRAVETDDAVIELVTSLRRSHPMMNKEEIQNRLKKKGHTVSVSTVGRIITRNNLFFGDSPAHRRKRGEGHSGYTDFSSAIPV